MTCTVYTCPLRYSQCKLHCAEIWLTDEENHISLWHLSKFLTWKSDKSPKIINPQSGQLSSNSMLNLTKGRESKKALQSSAKGVTAVVSHYSSYPSSFRIFGAWCTRALPTCQHFSLHNSNIYTWAHMHARKHFFFFLNVLQMYRLHFLVWLGRFLVH